MSRSKTFAVLAAMMLAGAASAAGTTLYKWVDAQGVAHYSDSPQPGAETVHVAPVQTYKATPVPATPAASQGSSSSSGSSSGGPGAKKTGAVDCSITSPQPDQSFFSPDSIAIGISINPPQEGDHLQVTYDGTPVEASGPNSVIQEPSRGSHTVSASVRGADGTVRCMAAPVTFNVQRPSALSPQSPVRAH
jgi:hypothetical protein